jgi:hypothetical protein
MFNFPTPYPDELIYSTVARAGVRLALTSPKQLLDEVFQNRKVSATVDLPCHLEKILHWLPQRLYDLNHLIDKHTIFPIYASFIPEERRQNCLHFMQGASHGALHLAVGLNASKVNIPEYLRYCPQCFERQLQSYGEWYWSRLWQIPGVSCCPQHGKLLNSSVQYRPVHKHEFKAACLDNCPTHTQEPASLDEILIAQKAIELCSLTNTPSANLAQWTLFYKNLALKHHMVKGKHHIVHELIYQKIMQRWPMSFLIQHGLGDLCTENSWLHHMFRKHRRSFSYLEHLIVIEAFYAGKSWTFQEIFKAVKAYSPTPTSFCDNTVGEKLQPTVIHKRHLWLTALAQTSIVNARRQNTALYTWLYRNDKKWLVETNAQKQMPFIPSGKKVNWRQRDWEGVKTLLRLYQQLLENLDSPRRTKTWWIKQLSSPSTIEKNLASLPLITKFLNTYQEDISCYQIRRLSRELLLTKRNNESISLWVLLRKTGLTIDRMTQETQTFLNHVMQHDQLIKV